MGAGASADKRKEIQALSKETGLSPLEVGALAQRFQQLCKGPTEVLTWEAVESNPTLMANPYIPRLYKHFPKDVNDNIPLASFVKTLSVFRKNGPLDQKLRFLFDLFDYNMNGRLDRTELEAMLELVRPDKVGFKREEIDKVIEEVDPKGQRQHISFDAFMAYCQRQPGINEMLTLDPAVLGAST